MLFVIKLKFKIEFDRLIDIGVLVFVDEFIDWVSNFVIVIKELGDLRFCLDL